MNKLLTAWLLATSPALASFLHHPVAARGEKYCPGPTTSVMCRPFDECGTGPNFGLCCPDDGIGPCTTFPPSPPDPTTTEPAPAPTQCFEDPDSGLSPSDWTCCPGPGGVYRCDKSSLCGLRPVFGLCCPIYSAASCSSPTGGITPTPTSTPTPIVTPTPTACPPPLPPRHLNPRGETYCDGPNGHQIMCDAMDECGTGEDFGLCCPLDTEGPCTPGWDMDGGSSTATSMPIMTMTTGPIITSAAELDNESPVSYPNSITYICVPGPWKQQTQPPNRPEPQPGEVIYVTKGEVLAWGGTAILERLPSGPVIKTPIPNPFCRAEENDHRRNMRLEARIYKTIGKHPRIPSIVNWDPETCCLTMEYLENGNLRDYIRQNHQNLTSQLRLQWARQAAEALAVLHAVDVIHCDLSPRNFLLDSDLNLKLSDFGGASVRGSEPSATPATRFRHPGYDWDAAPVFGDDIFSLGSLIYFIMTDSYPCEEIPSDEVEKLYEIQQFPETSHLVCGSIIMKCWCREVDTARGVHDYLTVIENNAP
ncbi:hypothetical protein FQN54_004017 [Arachnomyces sp. PD_36]|nr:hypothetical protein FQN54_004017 [Arachnomyces sp. PD_36]